MENTNWNSPATQLQPNALERVAKALYWLDSVSQESL
jgi:hypothetical protein